MDHGVHEYAVKRTEQGIRKLLLDLERTTDHRVDQVRVDTRNFANLSVEIFLEDKTKR